MTEGRFAAGPCFVIIRVMLVAVVKGVSSYAEEEDIQF
jgi:hypothetical protein